MSRFFVGLALWALLLALAACGGDSNGTDPARDAELAEMVDTVVSTYDDLTVCTDKREGTTAYVEDEKKAYVCDGDDWTEDDSLTNEIRSDSEKKSSSSAKAKSSSDETSDSSSNAKSSSSRDGKSNSSDEEISSSSFDFSAVSLASPCKTETEDNCEYGTLTDDRDGQIYKTVKIGEQWWMAENLNYAYTGVPFKDGDYASDSTSWCYDNDAANCAKYGRLYTWAAAMDSVGTWSTNGMGCGFGETCNLGEGKVRGVCPMGWHLPTQTEWNTLFTAVGGQSTAGKMLKSTSGWYNSGNGTDAYSFSALPAGYRNYSGYYDGEGYSTLFWSSTEYLRGSACYMSLYYDNDDARLNYNYKLNGFSVRCVKD
jgi:Fibrobacter succinogenes major domain (Fib_succ_major).